MKSKIALAFNNCKKQKRPALITYTVAGDNTKNNSLKILNKNGFILVHDCLPRSLAQQAVPRYRGSWNGDVWKAIVELRTKNNLNIFTSQIDFGVAIIQISENKKLLKLDINNFSELKFKDYYYNYKEFMNILDYEETLNKI